jgi:hypothetical protein
MAAAGGVLFVFAAFSPSDSAHWAAVALYCLGLGLALVLFGRIAEMQKEVDELKKQLRDREKRRRQSVRTPRPQSE